LALVLEIINVQTDFSTANTKATTVETIAQSNSYEQENPDTGSESGNWILPVIFLFLMVAVVISVLNGGKSKRRGRGGRGATGGGIPGIGNGSDGGDGGGAGGGDGGGGP